MHRTEPPNHRTTDPPKHECTKQRSTYSVRRSRCTESRITLQRRRHPPASGGTCFRAGCVPSDVSAGCRVYCAGCHRVAYLATTHLLTYWFAWSAVCGWDLTQASDASRSRSKSTSTFDVGIGVWWSTNIPISTFANSYGTRRVLQETETQAVFVDVLNLPFPFGSSTPSLLDVDVLYDSHTDSCPRTPSSPPPPSGLHFVTPVADDQVRSESPARSFRGDSLHPSLPRCGRV
jgi:hypothetical protein